MIKIKNKTNENIQLHLHEFSANESIEISPAEWFQDAVIEKIASGEFVLTISEVEIEGIQKQIQILSGGLSSVEVVNKDPDTNGIAFSPKWAPDGWHQCLHETEFETSKLGSIHEKDHNGDDLNWSTVKFYDLAMNELTTQGAIDTDCVWSVYDWMPTMDYAVKAGQVAQLETPADNVYFWAVGLPDVMPKMFADGGINLRFVAPRDPIGLSGVAATVLPYNGGMGTNKIRFKFYHPAGFKHRIQLIWEIFRA